MKILIVDDNEAICSGIREHLERANPTYCCEVAHDGDEALKLATANKPDIVIVDMLMPGMNGLSSARLISHRFPNTKILLHTAYGSEMLSANAARYGVFRVVDKADGKNLLAAIREIESYQQSKAS